MCYSTLHPGPRESCIASSSGLAGGSWYFFKGGERALRVLKIGEMETKGGRTVMAKRLEGVVLRWSKAAQLFDRLFCSIGNGIACQREFDVDSFAAEAKTPLLPPLELGGVLLRSSEHYLRLDVSAVESS